MQRAGGGLCDMVQSESPPDQHLKDQGDGTGLLEA